MSWFPAFAKINLGLKVLYRRDHDGFHDIATVFQTISLADRVAITATPAAETSVTTTSNVDIPGENLATRAAQAWLVATGLSAKVEIHIEKQIPMGGGLAGGSTDAVAVLKALPHLLGRAISEEQSAAIALELGSDLPFFLVGGCAEAYGRGEQLTPLADGEPLHGVLVAPGLHIATPAAFKALSRPRRSELTAAQVDEIMKRFRAFVRSVHELQPPAVWAKDCENDFEPVAFEQHPVLLRILEAFRESGAALARMSGSGSTMFGVYETAEAAAAAKAKLEVELSGHAPAFRVETFHTISRRQYERAWHTAIASITDGASEPPRSVVV